MNRILVSQVRTTEGGGSPAWEVVTGEQLMFVRISLHRAVGSGGVGFLGKEEEAGAP